MLALRRFDVDLATRRIHVREAVGGRLKDDESRVVPIQDALHPVLAAWRLKRGAEGTVVPPMRSDGEFCDDHRLRAHLRKVLEETVKIGPLTWYQATRHTFASQWVMGGQSMEKLREVMGHSTVQMTERYAHLRPELFGAAERGAIRVNLSPGPDDKATVGHAVVTRGAGGGQDRP